MSLAESREAHVIVTNRHGMVGIDFRVQTKTHVVIAVELQSLDEAV